MSGAVPKREVFCKPLAKGEHGLLMRAAELDSYAVANNLGTPSGGGPMITNFSSSEVSVPQRSPDYKPDAGYLLAPSIWAPATDAHRKFFPLGLRTAAVAAGDAKVPVFRSDHQGKSAFTCGDTLSKAVSTAGSDWVREVFNDDLLKKIANKEQQRQGMSPEERKAAIPKNYRDVFASYAKEHLKHLLDSAAGGSTGAGSFAWDVGVIGARGDAAVSEAPSVSFKVLVTRGDMLEMAYNRQVGAPKDVKVGLMNVAREGQPGGALLTGGNAVFNGAESVMFFNGEEALFYHTDLFLQYHTVKEVEKGQVRIVRNDVDPEPLDSGKLVVTPAVRLWRSAAKPAPLELRPGESITMKGPDYGSPAAEVVVFSIAMPDLRRVASEEKGPLSTAMKESGFTGPEMFNKGRSEGEQVTPEGWPSKKKELSERYEQEYARLNVPEVVRKKVRALIAGACAEKITHLYLTAMGCGAFKNPNKVVAKIVGQVLQEPQFQNSALKEVIFVIGVKQMCDDWSEVLKPLMH
eukprot:CAMPEP_0179306564 /NCGR_PEP_ID=MMETSP0797-20121207/50197_1 /TAXON_ID=47934 /ORGANISM="Dinophysis acuminata, Strain DAEP01" /LENGTH=519 /DNA_ID=CAMNT_0021016233 /DNA_START=123 /DNA_END=1682 /DNA_ORIENTATION=+